MRQVTHIVIHCSATPQSATVEAIQKYWRETMNWNRPGYHRIIKQDGTVVALEKYINPTNGVSGHNAHSIHICYIGGVDRNNIPVDNRTPAQLYAMEKLIRELKATLPHAIVCGHRDFPGVKKACPSFDVKAWIKSIGL
jgi:N-acetylmuramoyl-L-alanine amidase